ncbi:XdhC family protein [Streptomyces sp. NPDC004244]
MRGLVETARRWAAEGRAGFLARPVAEQGFGPRDPAGALLLDAGGECVGSLYRGVFDAALVAEAGAWPPGATARVCEVSVGAEEAAEARLTCGGRAEILLQPLAAVPAQWWELLARGVGVALVTRLNERADQAVSEVVRAVDTPVDEAGRRAGELLATRRPGRDAVYGDTGLVLVEACPSEPHVVIGGPASGELAQLVGAQARLLGWGAQCVGTVAEAEELLAARRDAACLVMLSHDPEFDVPTLRAALALGVPYVGALGSRRTTARRREGLEAAGVAQADVARVHGPIGLDLGARTPAETALAICAEILAVLSGHGADGAPGAPGAPGLLEYGGPLR